MIVYLDTSAYVKLIIDEAGAEQTRAIFQQARRAATSVVTYPEACAALSRRDREAGSPAKRLRSWTKALDQSWSNTLAVPILAKAAGSLALSHSLRGMDAVQLAAAMTLRERTSLDAGEGRVLFAAFDRTLVEAAEREGFATLGRPLE